MICCQGFFQVFQVGGFNERQFNAESNVAGNQNSPRNTKIDTLNHFYDYLHPRMFMLRHFLCALNVRNG